MNLALCMLFFFEKESSKEMLILEAENFRSLSLHAF